MQISSRSELLQRALLAIAVLTCSSELFLVINIGFNFKICQIAVTLAAFLFFIELATSRSRLFLPKEIGLLGFALFLSILYWSNSNLPQRSIGYSLWFAFDIIGIIMFFNIYRTYKQFIYLIRAVLISVCINSWFGLLQFVLGVLGFDPPLVSQWWIKGVLPRINGFNYEPSFFATYLELGWILSIYLLEKRAPLVGSKLIAMTAISSSIAMLMCSSRMGWFAMIIWLLRPVLQTVPELISHGVISKQKMRLFGVYAVILSCIIGSLFLAFPASELEVLVGGLGLTEGKGSFSIDDRSAGTTNTANIALSHLVFGVGFGGVPAEIANLSGVKIDSLDDAKDYEGKNITFELVASLGLVGALAIYLFFGLILRRALYLSKLFAYGNADVSDETKLTYLCLRGLSWSLIIQLLLLQFNQNFLRAYTWIFIGVLLATINIASRDRIINLSFKERKLLSPRFPNAAI